MTITDFQFREVPLWMFDPGVCSRLQQGGKAVFKRTSQAKLNMTREALAKLNRGANEQAGISVTV
jgi:hypothetical protein